MRLTYTLLVVSLHKINMLVSSSAPLNTRPSVRSSERQRIFLQRRWQGGQSEFWRSRRRRCERTVTAAWRSPNGGGNSKTGWELQNRAWLPPIDRQAHDTHAQFFLPINLSANSAPQLILKILLVVSITVNLISYYTMLQKMLTPKPTPYPDPKLNQWNCLHGGIGAEKKVAVQEIIS